MNTSATIFSSSPATGRCRNTGIAASFAKRIIAGLSLIGLLLLTGCETTETVRYPGTGLEFTVENPN